MKKENTLQKNSRRRFLKSLTYAGGLGSIALLLKDSPKTRNEDKVKLITANGTVVEVDPSKIEREVTTGRATDKEVLQWMNDNRNKF